MLAALQLMLAIYVAALLQPACDAVVHQGCVMIKKNLRGNMIRRWKAWRTEIVTILSLLETDDLFVT